MRRLLSVLGVWHQTKQMASQGDELPPFLLEVPGLEEAARREEERALRGSYGFVFKVTVGGVECIAKKLHSALVERVTVKERKNITAKFRNECIILSKLRHPNIVQFVGVHCGLKGNEDLSLIMECLKCDLYDFLSEQSDVPLSLKLSLLLDVSYGLVYLHECNPPIIHRDLTARNILITEKYQAKIADLGVAKIATLQEQLAQSHTQVPGQMLYMPPEATMEKAACTPKLDIFSFGHLALFTVIQEAPQVYTVPMTMDVQRNGTFERLKRQRSLEGVGSDHCLYPIITECLYDRPEQRPTTRDLNKRLINLSASWEDACLNPQCVNTKHLHELSEDRVGQLEDQATTLKKQIQDLELAKCEVLDFLANAKAEAEVYKRDFMMERKDREKAQGEIDLLRKMTAGLRDKVKEAHKRLHGRSPALSEGLGRHARSGVSQTPTAATYPLDKQQKQGEPPDSRPGAERNGVAGGRGQEAEIHESLLQQSINQLRMDLDAANDDMNQLKKEVEKHASEKEEQHSLAMKATVVFQNDPLYIPSDPPDPSMTIQEQLDKQFAAAKQMIAPMYGKFQRKPGDDSRSKTGEVFRANQQHPQNLPETHGAIQKANPRPQAGLGRNKAEAGVVRATADVSTRPSSRPQPPKNLGIGEKDQCHSPATTPDPIPPAPPPFRAGGGTQPLQGPHGRPPHTGSMPLPEHQGQSRVPPHSGPVPGQPHAAQGREGYHRQGHSNRQGWDEEHLAAGMYDPQSGEARRYEGQHPSSRQSENYPQGYQQYSSGQRENYPQSNQRRSSGHYEAFSEGNQRHPSGRPGQFSHDHFSQGQQQQFSGQSDQHFQGGKSHPSGHPSHDHHSQGGHYQSSGRPDQYSQGGQYQSSGRPDQYSEGGQYQSSGRPDQYSQGGQYQPPGHPNQHFHDHCSQGQPSGQPDRCHPPSSGQFEQAPQHNWGDQHSRPSHPQGEGSHERGGRPIRAGAQTHQPPQGTIEDDNNRSPDYMNIEYHKEQRKQQLPDAGGRGDSERSHNRPENETKPPQHHHQHQGLGPEQNQPDLSPYDKLARRELKEIERRSSASQLPDLEAGKGKMGPSSKQQQPQQHGNESEPPQPPRNKERSPIPKAETLSEDFGQPAGASQAPAVAAFPLEKQQRQGEVLDIRPRVESHGAAGGRGRRVMQVHGNQLQQSINHEIADMADIVQDEVSEDNMYKKTLDRTPYDPNLECPLCGKRHLIGEIQKFVLHKDKCDGVDKQGKAVENQVSYV